MSGEAVLEHTCKMTCVVARQEFLSPQTFLWEIPATEIAAACQPGQFVMVRLREGGERIPLTIADFDRFRGTITIVVKVAGRTTEEMSTYQEGDRFLDLIGPLGLPSRIGPSGPVVLVGGGIGVAPLYPIARGFHEVRTQTTAIIGFQTGAEIFWRDKFRRISHPVIVVTEDGGCGRRGTVVDALRQFLEDENRVTEVFTIGPIGMMQAVAEVTRPLKIPTWASMNPIMVDGIGMCGSCRVNVGGKVLFACVDGPDMDAHQVDFEELKARMKRFRKEEQASLCKYHQGGNDGRERDCDQTPPDPGARGAGRGSSRDL